MQRIEIADKVQSSVIFVSFDEARHLWPGCTFGKLIDFEGTTARRIILATSIPLDGFLVAVRFTPKDDPMYFQFICDVTDHLGEVPASFKRPDPEYPDGETFRYACACCALDKGWIARVHEDVETT